MITYLTVFYLIIFLFIILLIIKKMFKLNICVLCASISITWILLLILYWLGYFIDIILLALLMGQSIIGIYYLLEKRLAEKFYIFRLPFILTLTFFFYYLMSPFKNILLLIGILIIWSIGYIIYSKKNLSKFKSLAKQLIECCKNW